MCNENDLIVYDESSCFKNLVVLRIELEYVYATFRRNRDALVAQLVEHSAVNSHLYDQMNHMMVPKGRGIETLLERYSFPILLIYLVILFCIHIHNSKKTNRLLNS